jgi:hypothetical protein
MKIYFTSHVTHFADNSLIPNSLLMKGKTRSYEIFKVWKSFYNDSSIFQNHISNNINVFCCSNQTLFHFFIPLNAVTQFFFFTVK